MIQQKQQPVWTDEQIGLVAQALGQVRDTGRVQSGHEIIFAVLERIAAILKRHEGYREHARRVLGPRLKSPGWCRNYQTADYDNRSREHIEDDEKQRMIDVTLGESVEKVFGVRRDEPTDEEVDAEKEMTAAVHRVFQDCLFGRFLDRDWQLLRSLADGKTGVFLAKQFHMTAAAVSDRKIIQCGAIWRRVCHLMPPEPVGIVLREVA